ncbi:MAG: MarR family transcriptional regulator [Alphaproteobacteria bacterium]|jgi:DNA-binding MarR family transcriptional regulator|nr:MarR family transcriptional regulator [Alphaproteobacteria bacterium]
MTMAHNPAQRVDRAALARTLRPENSPGYLLWQAANHWQRAQRAALGPLGVTHVQFVLLAGLAWLEEHEGPVHQARLARFCHTDAMMTSQVLRALEREGLVARTIDPDDNRARRLSLTEAGADRLNNALPRVREADDRFFAALGPERRAMVDGLRTVWHGARSEVEDGDEPVIATAAIAER